MIARQNAGLKNVLILSQIGVMDELVKSRTMIKRQKVYQFVTAIQIVFSSLSLIIICLTLPLMYNNIQTTIDYAEKEMRFCEVRYF